MRRRGVVGRWEELKFVALLDGWDVLSPFVVDGGAVGLEVVFCGLVGKVIVSGMTL